MITRISSRVAARRPSLPLAVALAALGAPAAPRAASPDAVPLSPEAALTAGAVLASDDPGGGGWYNPAALGAVRRNSLQVGASAYSESGTVIHDASQSVLPWGSISGDIRSLNYSSVPSVLAYSFRLRDGLGVSIGVWTPYHDYEGGTTTSTSSGLFPGTPTVSATFAQTYGFTERRDDTWYGAAIGWQATRRLRLGVMLQGAYATDVWTVDLNASLRTTDPTYTGYQLVYSERGDQTVLALRPMFGLQWDASDQVRIAAAMRGPSYRLGGWGPVNKTLSYALFMPPPAPQPPSQNLVATQTNAPKGVSQIEPVRLYGGARWAPATGWTVSLEGDWHPALDGQFGLFKEGWNARLGATWRVHDDLWVGAGIFNDSASEEGTATRSSLRYAGFTAGAIYRATAVVKARKGGDDWDLVTAVAVRGAYGWGTYRGIYVAPYKPEVAFPDVPAETLEGSITFMTAIVF